MSAPQVKTHWKQLVDPRFVGVYALPNGEDMTVTIKYVQKETITMMGGKKEDHSLAYLVETKPLILNSTNSKTIEKLYGPYIEDWAGRRITLYASTTKLGSDMVECLRIRAKVPQDVKETLTDARMDKALAAVKKGDFAADTLRVKYALTDAQAERLAQVEAELASGVEAAPNDPGAEPEAA
jgi:hypothetical protein